MSTDNFRKYQIFISSTYTDLIDERRLIIDALLKNGFYSSRNGNVRCFEYRTI